MAIIKPKFKVSLILLFNPDKVIDCTYFLFKWHPLPLALPELIYILKTLWKSTEFCTLNVHSLKKDIMCRKKMSDLDLYIGGKNPSRDSKLGQNKI